MGKKDSTTNVPANPSLSWTTPALRSFVRLQVNTNVQQDSWQSHPNYPLTLSEFGQSKFLRFFDKLKQHFGLQNHYFTVSSGNNFPSDCGIASSASSFAALTLVCYQTARELVNCNEHSAFDLSALSRQGSGSSCRSFYPNWAKWQSEGAEPVSSSLQNLQHAVVVVESGKKTVSSSQAHLKVTESLLFEGRIERASKRFEQLSSLLSEPTANWQQMYQLTWAEFWDMHALFETSSPAFGYMTGKSLDVLKQISAFWEQHQDGPIATMDAGANVHCLWRSDQNELKQALYKQFAEQQLTIIGDN